MNKRNFALKALSLTWIVIGFVIFVASLSAYVLYTYHQTRSTIIKGIDQKLLMAARSTQLILGDDYHDRLNEVSSEEYRHKSAQLSQLAQHLGVEYVYAMIYDAPSVRFSASSYTQNDVLQDKVTRKLDLYAEATAVNKSAFRSTQPLYEVSQDKWGHFKTIFIPYVTRDGRVYLTGADIKTSHIQTELAKSVKEALFTACFFFAIALLVAGMYLLILRKTLTTDARTGFPNRLALEQDLAKSPNQHLSLAIVAIKELEEIVSFYGTDVGDEIMRKVMTHFSEFTVPFKVYRLATAKLVLLSDANKGEHYLSSLINEFPTTTPILQDPHLYIQVTAGIASGNKRLLLENAFIACRQAQQKQQRVCLYGQDPTQIKTIQESHIAIAKTVQSAFEQHRILPYFTPRMGTQSKVVEQYHCTPRVLTEQGLILRPDSFSDVIRHSRLSSQLTKVMLELCTAHFRKSHHAWSMQLSWQDLADPQMMEFIFAQLRRYPQPAKITFELEEQEVIEHFADMRVYINVLKSKGVNIMVASSNSGLLTISRVLKLTIDSVKLTSSVIEQLGEDTELHEYIEHIAKLCHERQIALLVDGVQSKYQLEQLLDCNVKLVEGSLIGTPGPHINISPDNLSKGLQASA